MSDEQQVPLETSTETKDQVEEGTTAELKVVDEQVSDTGGDDVEASESKDNAESNEATNQEPEESEVTDGSDHAEEGKSVNKFDCIKTVASAEEILTSLRDRSDPPPSEEEIADAEKTVHDAKLAVMTFAAEVGAVQNDVVVEFVGGVSEGKADAAEGKADANDENTESKEGATGEAIKEDDNDADASGEAGHDAAVEQVEGEAKEDDISDNAQTTPDENAPPVAEGETGGEVDGETDSKDDVGSSKEVIELPSFDQVYATVVDALNSFEANSSAADSEIVAIETRQEEAKASLESLQQELRELSEDAEDSATAAIKEKIEAAERLVKDVSEELEVAKNRASESTELSEGVAPRTPNENADDEQGPDAGQGEEEVEPVPEPESEPEPTPEPEIDPREILRERKLLIEAIGRAQAQQATLIEENTSVQTVIAEMMKRKKHNSSADSGETNQKNVADQELQFQKLLTSIRELERAIEQEQEGCDATVADISEELHQATQEAEKIRSMFVSYASKIAASVVSSRSGKKLPENLFRELAALLDEKEDIVKEERLKFLKLRSKLKKLESELAAKETLGDGLHFIDFEQLKIENQAHNEKIEERNEELTKLKNKTTTTIQVLSHLKEKLNWLEIDNDEMNNEVHRIEKVLSNKRDQVSRQKRNRDKLRKSNADLQRQCGLINQKTLLRDFEDRYDEVGECANLVRELQAKHANVKTRTKGFKLRLDQLKTQQPHLFAQ